MKQGVSFLVRQHLERGIGIVQLVYRLVRVAIVFISHAPRRRVKQLYRQRVLQERAKFLALQLLTPPFDDALRGLDGLVLRGQSLFVGLVLLFPISVTFRDVCGQHTTYAHGSFNNKGSYEIYLRLCLKLATPGTCL